MRALLYLFMGIVISTVYTPLAGGGVEHFVLMAYAGPIAAFAVLIALIFYRTERRDRILKERWGVQNPRNWFGRHGWGIFFWSLVVWICLPILFNQGSHLARWMGYPGLGDLLFFFRYNSIFMVGACLVVMTIAWRLIDEFIAFCRKERAWRHKPPAVSS